MTDALGEYAFPAMPVGGKYAIDPKSSDNYLNGVSTLDLVMIQRYILGLYTIEGPYKLIAADINKDGVVSALDLVDLRSTLLGFKDEFSNNSSWRFIDAGFQFEDPKRPFDNNFTEGYAIDALNSNMKVDFIGLKVGDVNGTASAAGVVAKPRSYYSIQAIDQRLAPGQSFEVALTSTTDEQIAGTQFTISFDADKMFFVGIDGEALALSPQHINTERASQGIITLSWNDIEAISVTAGEVLLNLSFESTYNGLLSDLLNITSKVTAAEVYNEQFETRGIVLNYSKENMAGGFELYQNTPNPFADFTDINFSLPRSGVATITIGDVTGKVVKIIRGEYAKGMNTVRLHKSDITDSGLLYYTLETEGHLDTKRMVVLK